MISERFDLRCPADGVYLHDYILARKTGISRSTASFLHRARSEADILSYRPGDVHSLNINRTSEENRSIYVPATVEGASAASASLTSAPTAATAHRNISGFNFGRALLGSPTTGRQQSTGGSPSGFSAPSNSASPASPNQHQRSVAFSNNPHSTRNASSTTSFATAPPSVPSSLAGGGGTRGSPSSSQYNRTPQTPFEGENGAEGREAEAEEEEGNKRERDDSSEDESSEGPSNSQYVNLSSSAMWGPTNNYANNLYRRTHNRRRGARTESQSGSDTNNTNPTDIPYSQHNIVLGYPTSPSPLTVGGGLFGNFHRQQRGPLQQTKRRALDGPPPFSSFGDRMVESMVVAKRLRGHNGCINSIEFNEDTSLLITGSDDLKVKLYDTTSWKNVATISTEHTANIFSAILMPNSCNRTVVSCGLDGGICVSDVTTSTSTIVHRTRFVMATKLMTLPHWGSGHVALAGFESGDIAFVDTRAKSLCHKAVLFHAKGASTNRIPINAIAAHPHNPNVFAFASDIPNAQLCDIRYLANCSPEQCKPRCAFSEVGVVVSRFKNVGIGGINFSDSGDRLLLNYKDSDLFGVEWMKLACEPSTTYMSEDLQTAFSHLQTAAFPDPYTLALRRTLAGVGTDGIPGAMVDTDKKGSSSSSSASSSSSSSTSTSSSSSAIPDETTTGSHPQGIEDADEDDEDLFFQAALAAFASSGGTSNSEEASPNSAPTQQANAAPPSAAVDNIMSRFANALQSRQENRNQTPSAPPPPRPLAANFRHRQYIPSDNDEDEENPRSSSAANDGLISIPHVNGEENPNKYVVCYRGRKNRVTMFKEATYFMDDQYVATGSDDGQVYFWEAATGRLVNKVKCDRSIVNGVLHNPRLPNTLIACGIDSDAKVVIPFGNYLPSLVSIRRKTSGAPPNKRKKSGDNDDDSGDDEENLATANEREQQRRISNQQEPTITTTTQFIPSSSVATTQAHRDAVQFLLSTQIDLSIDGTPATRAGLGLSAATTASSPAAAAAATTTSAANAFSSTAAATEARTQLALRSVSRRMRGYFSSDSDQAHADLGNEPTPQPVPEFRLSDEGDTQIFNAFRLGMTPSSAANGNENFSPVTMALRAEAALGADASNYSDDEDDDDEDEWREVEEHEVDEEEMEQYNDEEDEESPSDSDDSDNDTSRPPTRRGGRGVPSDDNVEDEDEWEDCTTSDDEDDIGGADEEDDEENIEEENWEDIDEEDTDSDNSDDDGEDAGGHSSHRVGTSGVHHNTTASQNEGDTTSDDNGEHNDDDDDDDEFLDWDPVDEEAAEDEEEAAIEEEMENNESDEDSESGGVPSSPTSPSSTEFYPQFYDDWHQIQFALYNAHLMDYYVLQHIISPPHTPASSNNDESSAPAGVEQQFESKKEQQDIIAAINFILDDRRRLIRWQPNVPTTRSEREFAAHYRSFMIPYEERLREHCCARPSNENNDSTSISLGKPITDLIKPRTTTTPPPESSTSSLLPCPSSDSLLSPQIEALLSQVDLSKGFIPQSLFPNNFHHDYNCLLRDTEHMYRIMAMTASMLVGGGGSANAMFQLMMGSVRGNSRVGGLRSGMATLIEESMKLKTQQQQRQATTAPTTTVNNERTPESRRATSIGGRSQQRRRSRRNSRAQRHVDPAHDDVDDNTDAADSHVTDGAVVEEEDPLIGNYQGLPNDEYVHLLARNSRFSTSPRFMPEGDQKVNPRSLKINFGGSESNIIGQSDCLSANIPAHCLPPSAVVNPKEIIEKLLWNCKALLEEIIRLFSIIKYRQGDKSASPTGNSDNAGCDAGHKARQVDLSWDTVQYGSLVANPLPSGANASASTPIDIPRLTTISQRANFWNTQPYEIRKIKAIFELLEAYLFPQLRFPCCSQERSAQLLLYMTMTIELKLYFCVMMARLPNIYDQLVLCKRIIAKLSAPSLVRPLGDPEEASLYQLNSTATTKPAVTPFAQSNEPVLVPNTAAFGVDTLFLRCLLVDPHHDGLPEHFDAASVQRAVRQHIMRLQHAAEEESERAEHRRRHQQQQPPRVEINKAGVAPPRFDVVRKVLQPFINEGALTDIFEAPLL